MRRVVVTGLGVISPVGNDVKTYFNNLISGKCGIDYITRFDTTDFKVKIAAEVKDFDPIKYMEKPEIRRTDLYAQYAVAAAAQAMESAGGLDVEPERLGVYFGSGIGGIMTFTGETEKLLKKGPAAVSPYFISMMISNIAAGLIAIKHNALGPSLPVVTACATSTNAIGEAFRAIRAGLADVIIAGGSEAAITPLAVAGFTSNTALTQRNDLSAASIPFDKRRDGFVIGEGAGVLILEEFERAKARKAEIYAEIKGYGNTCDAYHVTAPHPGGIGAAKAISDAAKEAGVLDEKLIYINAHGTSTELNDKAETLAIKKTFGKRAGDFLISSTKSMTGHCLGAAGAIEAIAAILAIKQGVIPPTIGYKEKDPDCDLNYIPNKAIKQQVEIALSNSFGFGGHNACVCFTKI